MRSVRISPQDKNIPAGWPRPHYLSDDGHPRYAQWSSETASGQIVACSPDRTFTAGAYNLCSSCGQAMERGLVFDRHWVNAHPVPSQGHHEFENISVNLGRMDAHDTHYGSPLCYRCAVFALKHCPFFSLLHDVYGEGLVWLVVTSAEQYHEFDDTSAITIPDPESLERVTTAQVMAEVRAGRLHLMDVGAEDLPMIERPSDFIFDGSNRVNESEQPKFTPEQVLEASRGRAGS